MKESRQLIQFLKNEAFVKFVFTMVPTAVSITTDKTCKRIIHNPEAVKIFRLNEWDAHSFSDGAEKTFQPYHNDRPLLPEEMPIQRSMWKGETVDCLEADLIWNDGVVKTVLANSQPILDEHGRPQAAISSYFDITEKKQLEQDLKAHKKNLSQLVTVQTETINKLRTEFARFDKLDMAGEMAASIAHEVRNPLTIVKGYLQFLLTDVPDKHKKHYESMINEIDNASLIISQFLELAQNKATDFQDSNLNAIVESLFPLIEADGLLKGITVKVETGDVPELFINEKEIRQLVINLVRNGIEAMSPGNTLTISTYVEGKDVVLSVKDQGEGISSENWDKIGESFFTTKNYGTGIGLPVCHRIAHKHNAQISFTSNPDGTTFYVKFKGVIV